MDQTTDIRDRASLSGREVQQLNFIKGSGPYVFRKFYRSGLRSHIFEVLPAEDILQETQGVVMDGIRMFPRARPRKMFRILRHKFETREIIFNEIKKYNLLLKYLGPGLMAESDEFIVEYTGTGTGQILLCGLQEYVEGEILDPWQLSGKDFLNQVFASPAQKNQQQGLVSLARKNINDFIEKIQQMIIETGFIPDLAGIGNLILTPAGGLKLVDINNIVKINLDDTISIDDKGYPSCDVSIQVLSILEQEILGKKISMDDPLYRIFLSPARKERVRRLEKQFYADLKNRV